MVSIRFARVGKPGKALFRLVAMNSKKSTKSPALEILGAYNPSSKDGEKITNLKKERLDHWIKVGAQLSDSTGRILKKENHLSQPVAAKIEARLARRKFTKKTLVAPNPSEQAAQQPSKT